MCCKKSSVLLLRCYRYKCRPNVLSSVDILVLFFVHSPFSPQQRTHRSSPFAYHNADYYSIHSCTSTSAQWHIYSYMERPGGHTLTILSYTSREHFCLWSTSSNIQFPQRRFSFAHIIFFFFSFCYFYFHSRAKLKFDAKAEESCVRGKYLKRGPGQQIGP